MDKAKKPNEKIGGKNKMKNKLQIKEDEFDAFVYPNIIVRVYPDPNSYNYSLNYCENTDDISDDSILNEIMERHYGAWKKLAEL